MELNQNEIKKMKMLARGTKGTFLIEFLKKVISEVADVRNPIKVEAGIENQVRKTTCEVIEDFIILPLKRYALDDTDVILGNDSNE